MCSFAGKSKVETTCSKTTALRRPHAEQRSDSTLHLQHKVGNQALLSKGSLSAVVGRIARPQMLAGDGGPGPKKEETPVERVPYREKSPAKKPETEESEKAPPLRPASTARPACDPKGLSRADYLAQPNTSTEDFGLTRFNGTVSMALSTRKVKGGVMLEPLQVSLPPITSVFTKADTFIEGTGVILGQGGECPGGGKIPLQWQIFSTGAAKIREGEIEHCQDLQYAFDVTFGWYAQVVDDLIAKKRVFASEAAAFKQLEKLTGAHPTKWSTVFECLVSKTEKRDGKKFTGGWHTPQVKTPPPRLKDGCAFSRVWITGAANFPELGQHPTPTVITGCSESAKAVKAVAAKAAAAEASTSGGDQPPSKPGEVTPKTPEPLPKTK